MKNNTKNTEKTPKTNKNRKNRTNRKTEKQRKLREKTGGAPRGPHSTAGAAQHHSVCVHVFVQYIHKLIDIHAYAHTYIPIFICRDPQHIHMHM